MPCKTWRAVARRQPNVSGSSPPSVLGVTTETDTAISQPVVERVVRLWRAQGAQVQTHRFSAGLQLDHNFIDPGHPKQRVDATYPVILAALE